MGQCSTLPSATVEGISKPHRYRDEMTTSSDNSATPLTVAHQQEQKRHQEARAGGYYYSADQAANNNFSPHEGSSMLPPRAGMHQLHNQYQSERPQLPPITVPQPMITEERDTSTVTTNILPYSPPPPESAIRQRCYKLNLESEYVGIHSASVSPRPYEGQILGPFASEDLPPALTYSGSEDSSSTSGGAGVAVAIQTAQIFRGITVAKDGTILTQNARATRHNRSSNSATSKTKRGEKSRQAAKIDQAKDLVEEAVTSGRQFGDEKESQMVSLFIMGEYDEMKQLVRDGSKKLREAVGLPDDSLLAVNRPRGTPSPVLSPTTRKRGSPFTLGSPPSSVQQLQHHHHHQNSPSSSVISSPMTPTSSTKARHSNSTNTKLNGHPRDPARRGGMENTRPSTTRQEFSPLNDPCNDMFGSSLGLTRGLNSIWNCGINQNTGSGGGGGPETPTNKDHKGYSGHHNASSSIPRKPIVEGRHDHSYRGGNRHISERMEPPSNRGPSHLSTKVVQA